MSPSSQRLWFQFEEFYPLAEHALACAQHHLTRAELDASARRGPALALHWDAGSYRLTSNGTPAWYNRDGDAQYALGSTWRHTATGALGVSLPDGDTAYLPLSGDARGNSPLITRLRAARDGRAPWVALDVSRGPLLDASAVEVLAERGELAPPDAAWEGRVVQLDVPGSRRYWGYVPVGYTTPTGEEIARFDRRTVEKLGVDFAALAANPDRLSDAMPGEHPVLGFYDNAAAVSIGWQIDDPDDLEAVRITDVLTPDPDGLYAVGAYQWPWRRSDEPRPDDQ